jgi:hypothetical protein
LSGAPLSDTDDDGVFRLTIHSDQDRYRAGQLIEIGATLTFLGPGETIQALGSGSGLAGYGLRLAGSSLAIGAAFTSDCAPYAFTRDMPISYPFTKSGGFGDDDPFKAFYESYFASPDLRLPAGTWTITAGAGFGTGADCGDAQGHSLSASVTIVVVP